MNNTHPWIERYRSHMVASGRYQRRTTVTDRCELLYRLDAELPLGLLEATIEELEHWMASGCTPATRTDPDGKPWSRQTKATYYGHITGFYRFAADPNRTPFLSYDPSLSLCRPKVPEGSPRPVETGDLARIMQATRGRVRIYCLLSAYAGLRPVQISNLVREDITADSMTVLGKGGKTTAIPTHPLIWAAVRELPPGPIAVTRLGRAGPGWVSIICSRAICRALGRPGVSLRNLRHWFATNLLLEAEYGGAGANLRTVQELMGHANVATTAIYTRVVGKQRRMAISALPPLTPTSN